jgi:hypothetical protein
MVKLLTDLMLTVFFRNCLLDFWRKRGFIPQATSFKLQAASYKSLVIGHWFPDPGL